MKGKCFFRVFLILTLLYTPVYALQVRRRPVGGWWSIWDQFLNAWDHA